MTRVRRFLVAVLTLASVDAVVYYRLVWVAMLAGGSVAASLVVGQVLRGCDRGCREVDDLARARARRDAAHRRTA